MSSDTGCEQPEPQKEKLTFRFAAQYGTVIWVRILSFLSVIAYARLMPQYDVGSVLLALAIFEILSMVSDAGFSQYATVKVAEDAGDWKNIMSAGLQMRIFLLLPIALFLMAGWKLGNNVRLLATALMCSSLLPYAWIQNARAYWNGKHRILKLQIASATGYTFGFGVSMALAYYGYSAFYVIAGLTLSFWLEWGLTVALCKPEPPAMEDRSCYLPQFKTFLEKQNLPEKICAALPYGLFGIAWFFYLRMDLFLLEIYDADAMAEYGISIKLYNAVLMLMQGGMLVILSDSKKIDSAFSRLPVKGAYMAIAAAVCCGVFAIYGPKMIIALLPEKYGDIESTTRILILAGYLQAAGLTLASLALGTRNRSGKTMWLIYAAAAALIISLTIAQNAVRGGVYWEYNRLGADFVIFICVSALYARYRNEPEDTEEATLQ